MKKWHVSEQCIYDENGQQIIEASEWYMRGDLQKICDEHNKLRDAIELLKEFAFYCADATTLEHCNQALKVQEFLKTTYAKEWLKDIFEKDRIQALINEAPDECPITGLSKCESYTIDDNVVYLTNPAYDAYTLPEYDEEEKAFYRTKYDLDDDCRETIEHLCDLEDLEERKDFEKIKQFYGIQ